MLNRLLIKNLAIIKEIEIDFTSGMNVITGETGAGKSMLIEALTLLSGWRASSESIRDGEDTCEVQGLFETKNIPNEVIKHLSDSDIKIDDELLIRRVVQRGGRSRAYINGVVVTQGELENIGEKLFSILSQHEHQQLFQPVFQLELLDRFLKNDDKLEELKKLYSEWRDIENKYNELKNSQGELTKKADYLKYQISEIKEHDLGSGDEEKLSGIVTKADHASAMLKTLYSVREAASQGDDSAASMLGRLIPDLSRCKNIDPETEKLLDTLNDVVIKLDELSAMADGMAKGYDIDEAELELNREKLSEIKRLKKKFSCGDLDAVIKICESMENELTQLENMDEIISGMETKLNEASKKYNTAARELSSYRKKNSLKLSKKIETILSDLGMFKGGFTIKFSDAEVSPHGVDRVDYLISTNPGEPEKQISKIASGGEMSRLMLAVQAATNEVYGYGLQIFDEVDAGIGGDIGFKVGGLVKNISSNHQTIVITHLPQIAVFADSHVRVWKEEQKGRMVVKVDSLKGDDRFNEVTRMLGMHNQKSAVANAMEMLEKAKRLQQNQTL
ncbi:MAG: DNA repair protein RecN [Pseudomonadota bacterium]